MDAVPDARVDIALAVAVDAVGDAGGDEGEELAGRPGAIFFDGVAISWVGLVGWMRPGWKGTRG